MKTYIKDVEGFGIYFEALPEITSLQDLLPDDTEEQLKEIEDYELFIAKVTAEKEGIELGCDYLGGCIYESVEEFYTTFKGDYFADMVKEAVEEAKQTIQKLTVH